MVTSPIKFGTSGWRGLIADDFTFASVRLAVTAIAEHVNSKKKNATILVGYDTRFYSEEFSQLAVDILQQNHIKTLLCETFTPTPAIAYEIMRRKLDGAINFTASHNPAQYHGLKFSSADAGPALPEVTKDIEARAAKLAADGGVPKSAVHHSDKKKSETVNLRNTYLKRLEELVRFDTLRKGKAKFVVDALHGAGAGYLDGALAEHKISARAMRTDRLGLSLNLPIFRGGALRQNLHAQNALVDQALAAYEATVLAAYEEVENALTASTNEHLRRDALQLGVESARRASDLALTQYNSGLVDFQTVLNADRQLITLEDSLAVSDGEVTANLVRLYKALGGGWSVFPKE